MSRILVVSFDSANAGMLDRKSRDGSLPNLARLRQQGAAARLSAVSASVESDYHNFYSGLQIPEHGHASYDEIIPGTYRSALSVAARTKAPTYWETLSEAGKTVLILNPVHARWPEHINGTVIVDWLIHDAHLETRFMTRPPELAGELARRFPTDPVNRNDFGHSLFADPDRLLAAKTETLNRKTEVITDLMYKEEWDACHVGLDEAHEISHLFWHYSAPEHPRHARVAGKESPVDTIVQRMDAALGRLLEAAGDDTTVLVVSIAGIAANYHWSHLVDDILKRLEPQQPARVGAAYQWIRSAWNHMPRAIQVPLYVVRHRFREKLLEEDRRRRRAFALPLNERSGAVRINLAGREPDGLVQPGPDYDRLCEELTDVFTSLRCKETGARLVRSVTRSADRVSGPFAELLPDLMVEWNVEQPIHVATSPRTGEIRREFNDARTGQHINDGFLLVRDARARPVALPERIDVADVAHAIIRHARCAETPFGEGGFG